jgi:urease accessory protein
MATAAIPTTTSMATATTITSSGGPDGAGVLDLLRLLQFGDSVLPVGAFSFSAGLESAVQQGVVRDPDTLQGFVQAAVRQAATGDGIALLHAHRAAAAGDAAGVLEIDQAVFNRRLNEEMRTMTVRMGRKLAELCEHVRPAEGMREWLAAIKAAATPGTYPVAQAIAFAGLGLPERDAFAAHQYGVASMLVGAAVRLMRMNYLDAQAVLFAASAVAADDYAAAADTTLDDMATFAPVMEVLSGIHLRSTVRLFMS